MKQHEIFIVDDSRVQLVFLEKILTNQGFSIESFTKGWGLIDSLEYNRPNLIISDIDMPSLNGFELIQEINLRFEDPGIPFFFMSSQHDIATEKRAQKMGAQALVAKPFECSKLLSTVDQMLGLARV